MNKMDKILKNGALDNLKIIDYSSPAKRKQLEKLKKKRDKILQNKNVNWAKLSQYYITK